MFPPPLRTLLAAAVLLGTGLAQANDSAFFGDGATVFAFKERRVRMVRETVTVRYQPQESQHHWSADCEFRFRSEVDEPIEVQMGFPDWRQYGDAPEQWAIADFRAKVDGRGVTATHKAIESRPASGDAAAPGQPEAVELGYDGAYTWQVHFEPRGQVVVHNTYRFGGLTTMGPLEACTFPRKVAELEDLFWQRAGLVDGGRDFPNGVCSAVSYIVTTGKTWAAPIGAAEIAIELPPSWPHLIIPIPHASSVADGWVRWSRRDWEPDQELTIVLLKPVPDEERRPPLFDTEAQAEAWLDYASKNGFGKDVVELMLRAYRYYFGGPADPAVEKLFGGMGMYERPPTPPEPLATDRAVMSLLARYTPPAGVAATSAGPAGTGRVERTGPAAGPTSPATDAPPEVAPSARGCGCRVVDRGGSPLALGLMLLVAASAWRRRLRGAATYFASVRSSANVRTSRGRPDSAPSSSSRPR